jgi:DNA invertase Pin-like site-specific DNA recombinase
MAYYLLTCSCISTYNGAKQDFNMRPAYIYNRCSDPVQRKGRSLVRQTSGGQIYAEAQGYTVVEIITDDGVPAYHSQNLKKGGLGAFLEAAKNGLLPPNPVLIVESLDRLSRDTVLAQLSLLLQIIEAGIEIVTPIDKQHYTAASINANPLEIIISLAIMIRAQDESNRKAERIAAAWDKKRANITTIKLTKRCPDWLTLNQDRTRFTVDEGKAAVVRRIFEFARNGLAPSMIAESLEQSKVPCWLKGGHWTTNNVLRILRNRAVKGEYQPEQFKHGKWQPVGKPILDYFPPVVSPSTWLAVNRFLDLSCGPVHGVQNLLIGLVWDGQTKRKMTRDKRCMRKSGVKSTSGEHPWLYRVLETSILEVVTQTTAGNICFESASSMTTSRSSPERAISELDDRIRSAIDRVAAGNECAESLAQELKALHEYRARLQYDLQQLNSPSRAAEDSDERTMTRAAMRELATKALDGDKDARLQIRQILRQVVSRIELWPKSQKCPEFQELCPSLLKIVEARGFACKESLSSWPCYKISYANGQVRWVCAKRMLTEPGNTRKASPTDKASILICLSPRFEST